MADQSVGYFTGMMDLYYAVMKTADTAASKPTYEAPKVLAKSIEVEVTPEYKEGKLRASNATVRDTKRIDGYSVKFTGDRILAAVQQELFGRIVDKNKVQIVKGANKPATVALGMAFTLDDNTREMWWLYKGEFAELTKKGKTEGENIEYQTPEIVGSFVRRVFDDALAAVCDTSTPEIAEETMSAWFTKVYETEPGA